MRFFRRGWITCLSVVAVAVFGASALADTEPGNNLRHRAELIAPGTHAGMVGGGDKKDWYKFPVTGGDIIRVTVDETTGEDVSIRLRDHEDSYLEACERGRTLVYLTAFELGQRNWYLKVEGEGAYKFTLATVRQNDAGTGRDAPRAFKDAVAIGGGVHRGMLGDKDKKDVFKFTAAPGQIVTIELLADFSRFDREMDSIELRLRSPDDSYLENVHSYGDKETLTYGPLGEDEAGVMRIAVSGEGDYEFFVPLLGDAAPTPVGPVEVQPGATQPGPAPTGEPQTVQFGGAGRFRFYFPVQGQGNIEARVEWEPQVAAEVMLFSPGQKMPVARTRGLGSAVLTYAATSSAAKAKDIIPLAGGGRLGGALQKVLKSDKPDAGKAGEWMLQVVPQPPNTVIQGRATVQFPGSDAGRLEWRPFKPATALGKAALASYLRAADRVAAGKPPASRLEVRLKERMSKDPKYAAELKTTAQSYTLMPQQQRLEVVGAPSLASAAGAGAAVSADTLGIAGALQAQGTSLADAVAAAHGALTITAKPDVASLLRPMPDTSPPDQTVPDLSDLPPPRLTIRFNYIYCFDETTWDGGSNSDEIYYLIGLIGPDGKARGAMSDEFGDFDDGEARPVKGVAAQQIMWQGEITGDTYCVAILMEHDYSSRDGVFRRFLSALEDSYADVTDVTGDTFDVAGGVAGGAAAAGGAAGGALVAGPIGAAIGAALGALFGWIISGMADDVLGEPVAVLITREDAAARTQGPGYVWSIDFRGDGAHYGLMFTFGKQRRFGD